MSDKAAGKGDSGNGKSSESSVKDLSSDSELSFEAAQRLVDEWIQSIGVRYFSELTNLAQLTEEVGELARVVSRTYGEQSWKASDTPSDLSDEMADVLFVLICLANQTGVDLSKALRANLTKKTARDSQRHLSNPKLHPPKSPESKA
jgi:NTP pyrophosphatase (non-canonical NTP hydrolase)